MLVKTRGIVLNYIKFKESSIIVRIYTEQFGVKSFIVNGIRSNRSKKSIGYFQPLTLLDMVIYEKPTKAISRISEYKILHSYNSIPFDIKKSSIALFLSEFLMVTIKEEDQQEQFDFVFNSFIIFDEMKTNYNDFHLLFIIKMSRYLGFGITTLDNIQNEGLNFSLSDKHTIYLNSLINESYYNSIKVENIIRLDALELILLHYKNNFDNWHLLKSIKILKEVFK